MNERVSQGRMRHAELAGRLTAAFAETGVGSTVALEGLLARLYRDDVDGLGHLHRVAALATRIGDELEIPAAVLADLERAALLHDIGRFVVPDPPALAASRHDGTTLQRRAVQVQVACAIARAVPFLVPASAILEASVECFDGTGYPDGRRGEATPLPARVLHLADTLDTLHAICEAMDAPIEATSAAVVHQTGSRFDPAVVSAWLRSEDAVPPPLVPWWSSGARWN